MYVYAILNRNYDNEYDGRGGDWYKVNKGVVKMVNGTLL